MMILCRTEIENEFVLDAKKMCWVAQPFLKTWSFEFHFVFEKRLRNKIGNSNNVIHIIMIKTRCELWISFTIWNSVIANLKKVISEIILTFKSSFFYAYAFVCFFFQMFHIQLHYFCISSITAWIRKSSKFAECFNFQFST